MTKKEIERDGELYCFSDQYFIMKYIVIYVQCHDYDVTG